RRQNGFGVDTVHSRCGLRSAPVRAGSLYNPMSRDELVRRDASAKITDRRGRVMPTRTASLALAAALAAAAPVLAQTMPTIADIEYAQVDGEPLLLDLYLPDNVRGAPLLVWIHGGAWQRGSKRDMPLGALVERGFAIASVEFRQANVAPFPAQMHDIKAAIRYLRARAAEHGYDATRIGVLGASSGGHLAALVGTTNGHPELEGNLGDYRDQSSAVQAIVSYFGASNLTTILAQSTPFGLRIREPALATLLGAPPD